MNTDWIYEHLYDSFFTKIEIENIEIRFLGYVDALNSDEYGFEFSDDDYNKMFNYLTDNCSKRYVYNKCVIGHIWNNRFGDNFIGYDIDAHKWFHMCQGSTYDFECQRCDTECVNDRWYCPGHKILGFFKNE